MPDGMKKEEAFVKKKKEAAAAITLLSLSTALCIRLMKKAGERLEKSKKKKE